MATTDFVTTDGAWRASGGETTGFSTADDEFGAATAPDDLSLVVLNSWQIDATFDDNSSDELEFRFQYDTDAAFSSPQTVQLPSSEGVGSVMHAIAPLEEGTRYYMRVAAVNQYGIAFVWSAPADKKTTVGEHLQDVIIWVDSAQDKLKNFEQSKDVITVVDRRVDSKVEDMNFGDLLNPAQEKPDMELVAPANFDMQD